MSSVCLLLIRLPRVARLVVRNTAGDMGAANVVSFHPSPALAKTDTHTSDIGAPLKLPPPLSVLARFDAGYAGPVEKLPAFAPLIELALLPWTGSPPGPYPSWMLPSNVSRRPGTNPIGSSLASNRREGLNLVFRTMVQMAAIPATHEATTMIVMRALLLIPLEDDDESAAALVDDEADEDEAEEL